METNIRSIVKSLSYRIFGSIVTFLISYMITGKIVISASIGGADFISKIVLYYLHERSWSKIKWGLK
jgi:uncharacterized membrane protein